jgi:hypothetical protein
MHFLKTIVLALMLLFTAFPLTAQTRTDSSASPERGRAPHAPKFVDHNGDGIDDRVEGRGPGRQRGKDKFIDKDGDGICDSRASGLGFRHGAPDAGGAMKGKAQRKGQGGKP